MSPREVKVVPVLVPCDKVRGSAIFGADLFANKILTQEVCHSKRMLNTRTVTLPTVPPHFVVYKA